MFVDSKLTFEPHVQSIEKELYIVLRFYVECGEYVLILDW